MDDATRRAIEWDCARNTVRFYNRLDAVKGEEAAALFCADGIWFREGDAGAFRGRAEIAAHVNRLPERGDPAVAPADRMVFHLVTNLEVEVKDDASAEVRALTVVVPGVRGKAGAPGTSKGIVAIFPTVEQHRRTAEGWRIAEKRTSRALRMD